MRLAEARTRAGDSRKKGTAKAPNKAVAKSLRRERLTMAVLCGVRTKGKEIAAVGQMAPQVKQ
jgi:hypothetical protein